MPSGSVIIIGSGPGIGRSVAAEFAAKGFSKFALLARREEQLAADRDFVLRQNASADVKTYTTDVTQLAKLKDTLQQAGSDLGLPEVVLYNAARVQTSKLLETSEEEMNHEFQIACPALHVAAKWAIPQMVDMSKQIPASKPSFFVTNSLLPQEPEPHVFNLSLAKAAQFNLAQSLAQVYSPQGVHVGVLVVGGVVNDSSKTLSARNIAVQTYEFYDQPKDLQTFTVEFLE